MDAKTKYPKEKQVDDMLAEASDLVDSITGDEKEATPEAASAPVDITPVVEMVHKVGMFKDVPAELIQTALEQVQELKGKPVEEVVETLKADPKVRDRLYNIIARLSDEAEAPMDVE